MPYTITGIGTGYDDGGRVYQAEMEVIMDNGALGVNQTTAYVLVDLDDTTNFPHIRSNAVILKGIRYSFTPAAGTWSAYVGVILENDAADGTMSILDSLAGFSTAGGGNVYHPLEDSFNCQVTSGVMDYTIDYDILGATALLRSGDYISSPAGKADANVTQPAPGDLVLYCNEDTVGGSLLGRVQVLYSTV